MYFRLIFGSTSSGVRGSGAGAEVMAAPPKMSLKNKVYVKLKDEPLVYAQLMWAVRSAAECRRVLASGAALHAVHAASGRLAPLEVAAAALRSRDQRAATTVSTEPLYPCVYCTLLPPNRRAALALQVNTSLMMNRPQALMVALKALDPVPGGAAGAAGAPARVRADVNARADVAMMMNNVNRKPIEMVYVDSDDEGDSERSASSRFKGLEFFEDLEDFDL